MIDGRKKASNREEVAASPKHIVERKKRRSILAVLYRDTLCHPLDLFLDENIQSHTIRDPSKFTSVNLVHHTGYTSEIARDDSSTKQDISIL